MNINHLTSSNNSAISLKASEKAFEWDEGTGTSSHFSIILKSGHCTCPSVPFLTTLLAVAEMERNLILERTQEGKMIAKQNPDFKEGRPPKYTKKQLEHALQLLDTNSYKQVEEITGISKSTMFRAKKKKRIQNLFNKLVYQNGEALKRLSKE
ncbi:hypothetical protein SAMN05877842_1265 [Ureibacillus acetophenoni]|uniref:Resolvase/invertase-type recombinase catalytic domain-containing protein n=1 Tax=Ureibacillus acetophenoni TaxID=614649 RepID=A0A285UT36_9BACL|nr:hypothetical protein SAMN05877842_1265 [Ureibacillus acetophenoni]